MTFFSTRRFFLQGAAVTGVAATVAGCSQQSPEQQAQNQRENNAAAVQEQLALPSTGWERLDYDQVADGGSLTLQVAMIPSNWNANHSDGGEVSNREMAAPRGISEFTRVGEDGTLTLNPDYVESAEVTSEDPQIVTVKFNKNAVWDTGERIVVADLKAQWQALNGSNPEFSALSNQGWSLIKDIRETDDDQSAEIEYSQSFPDWIGYVFPSGPAAVYATPEAFNTGYADQPTPGCGPFSVSNVDSTSGVVTLSRNDKWWGRAPKLESIVFRVTTQQNAPSAFANAEIDALANIADGDTYGQAKSRPDAVIQKSNGLTWSHLTLNVGDAASPLQDAAVREALFKAIDREAVARAIVAPLEAPVILQDHYLYMPGQAGYEDSFDGALAPENTGAQAAREILEAAGYVEENGVYAKDGASLEFSIVIPAETKSNEDRSRQMMTNLNDAGFKVSLQTVPADKYFPDYVSVGNFNLVTFGWVGTATPELASANLFLPGSGQNYTGYNDDALVEIDSRLQSEMDPQARREISNEFSRQVASSYTILPLFAVPVVYALKDGIVNYGAAQFESVDWTQVGMRA